jgi:hypothetical protein
MESFLSFDVRILRTLWPLVRRPGFLTVEFLEGRRARYIHPFKIYFAFSVLFFLVLSMSGYSVVREGSLDDDSISGVHFSVTEGESEVAEAGDEEGRDPSQFDRAIEPIITLAENDPALLNRIFTDRLAKLIILMVPVFAVLLWPLYRRRRYVAHVVFSLHLHSFAFLVIALGMAVDFALAMVKGSGLGNGISVLAVLVYSFIALRTVYGQGRILTFFKMVILILCYLVALIVTMIFTLAVTAVTV